MAPYFPTLGSSRPLKLSWQRRLALASSILLVGILSACQGASLQSTTHVVRTSVDETFLFTQGDFSVELPQWQKGELDDEGVLHMVSDGVLSVWVKRLDFVPHLVSELVAQWTDETAEVTLVKHEENGRQENLELILSEEGETYRMQVLLMYCGAMTYEVTVVAPEHMTEDLARLSERVHRTATCNLPVRPPHRATGALGMVVIPPSREDVEFDMAAYQQSLAMMREHGVQVSHFYFEWGGIETAPGVYDWSIPDYFVEVHHLEGYELSLVVDIIHTTVRGKMPSDVADLPFDDPHFVDRLSEFLVKFVDRYEGRIHYLWIGNEVNDYFGFHREEIDAYGVALERAIDAIQARHADLPIGTVFAYHDAEGLGTLDVIQELNRGDMIAYTLYLHKGFHFDQDPGEVGAYLDRMLAHAGDTPVAIVETGWSTAQEVGGSEDEQAEYVQQVFSAFSARVEQIRFLTWFILHDSLREHCEEQALTFIAPEVQIGADEMETFVTFLCHLGLREVDGTPKLGWETWLEEAERW